MDTIDKMHNPFLMPEGYLDGFTEKMMARIDAVPYELVLTQNRKKKRSTSIRYFTRYAAGVAATLVFFFVLSHRVAVHFSDTAAVNIGDQDFVAQTDEDLLYEYMLMTEQNVYDYEVYNN